MAGETGDRLNAAALIDDQRRVSRAPGFAGGTLVVLGGDVSLDLREARPNPAGAAVRVVDVRAAAITSDIEDREAGSMPSADGGPTLVVNGLVLLGDVVVRRAG